MRPIAKTIFIIICLLGVTTTAYGQADLEKSLKGIKSVNDAITQLFEFFKNTDSTINKEKLKNMGVKLYGNINDIVEANQQVIEELKNGDTDKARYTKSFTMLRNKLILFGNTVSSYSKLIAAGGINATELNFNIRQDIIYKNGLLEKGIREIKTNGYTDGKTLKMDLIKYLNDCIGILKQTKTTLKKFN